MASTGTSFERCYAIGDVHGFSHQLDQLFVAIADHAGDRAYDLVFVGDYVDKGPDSAGVLQRLMGFEGDQVRLTCILGNHARMMQLAARDEASEAKWFAMGGAAVLAEYGVARARDLPADVLAWVAARPTSHEDAQRYFVHAGVDPLRPLEDQTDEIRLSMRGRFLTEDHDFGKHVVHGHTPMFDGWPTLTAYRTNLDTGVAVTGKLTAAMFGAQDMRPATVLQADGSKVTITELPWRTTRKVAR